jgi:hypothetical protein
MALGNLAQITPKRFSYDTEVSLNFFHLRPFHYSPFSNIGGI